MSDSKPNRPAGRLKAEEDESDCSGVGGESPNTSQLVLSLNSHDVILGRGQHVKNTLQGNNQFRAFVRTRAVDYYACQSKAGKDVIARQIMQLVLDKGGRFVRKVETDSKPAATPAAGSPRADESKKEMAIGWEMVDEATVLVKVKQSFRDYSVVARKAAVVARKRLAASSASAPAQLPPSQSNVASMSGSNSSEIGSQNVFAPQHPTAGLSPLAMLQSARYAQELAHMQSVGADHRPFQSFDSSNPLQRLLLQEAMQRDQQQQMLSMLARQRDQSLLSGRIHQLLPGTGHLPNGNNAIGVPSLSSSRLTQDAALLNQITQRQQQDDATLLNRFTRQQQQPSASLPTSGHLHRGIELPATSSQTANNLVDLESALQSFLQQRQMLDSSPPGRPAQRPPDDTSDQPPSSSPAS